MGKGVYRNVNFTCVDDADIVIGDWCMFGPNVVIATAGHPILPILREHRYTYAIPVHIGGERMGPRQGGRTMRSMRTSANEIEQPRRRT